MVPSKERWWYGRANSAGLPGLKIRSDAITMQKALPPGWPAEELKVERFTGVPMRSAIAQWKTPNTSAPFRRRSYVSSAWTIKRWKSKSMAVPCGWSRIRLNRFGAFSPDEAGGASQFNRPQSVESHRSDRIEHFGVCARSADLSS